MAEVIHLYHTNDLHSHFEMWPRIRAFLNCRRQLHQQEGEEMVIMDIGDHTDRWHPFTEGMHGSGNVTLLNDAGYQYATIGNNEGITLSHEELDALYKTAEFHVLCGNIYELDGLRPQWASPYTVHTTKQGTRIGLFGLTADFRKFYNALGWKVTDPFEELPGILDDLKQKSDIIVMLSHLGIHDDERIAAEYEGIDAVLGAHTHHVLPEGKIVGDTLLCGAGKYGMYAGHAELRLDDAGHIVSKYAELYETKDLPEIEGEKEWEDKLREQGTILLQEVITEIPAKLESEWFKPSELPALLCEALREWADADCAFLNAGLLLDGLEQGPVTKADLHRILPHPINPCIITANGRELEEILVQSANPDWPKIPLKGLGFRGKIMGMMVYDRIAFAGRQTGGRLLINGNQLDYDRMYRLAIPDMFTFGHFFPQIPASSKEYMMPEFLRDIMAWKLKRIKQK